jgi:hypothetical protein
MVQEWNCICGFEGNIVTDSNCCASVIFTSRRLDIGGALGTTTSPYETIGNNMDTIGCDTMPCRESTRHRTIFLSKTAGFNKFYQWYIGDKVPNDSLRFDQNDSTIDGVSLSEVIQHELGHGFGLAVEVAGTSNTHPQTNIDDLMYPAINFSAPLNLNIGVRDLNTLRFLYDLPANITRN